MDETKSFAPRMRRRSDLEKSYPLAWLMPPISIVAAASTSPVEAAWTELIAPMLAPTSATRSAPRRRRRKRRYVFADYCSGEVWSAAVDGPRASDVRREAAVEDAFFITFGEDGAGELYLAGSLGDIYRLDPR